ncbi:MAG: ArsA family ATPase [Candidatus Nezhaarchaeota archaeon]|nr:ArsA family ATPase [Candidatus Nezhaarchaeota archaeon]
MRVIVYTGKGGTGKSALSCATALRAAEAGSDVLVMSSDPAHTLSDLLEARVGHEPTKVADHLWALQVDPLKEVRERYRVVQDYVAKVFMSKGLDETLAFEVASLPNMTPFLSMLKLVDIVEEGGFDAVLLDTVPSGEALKNLYLPMLVGPISRKLLKLASSLIGAVRVIEPILKIPAPSKEVIRADVELIEKIEELKRVLIDQEKTSLRLVANPDSFSIENAKRAYMTASLYGINTDLVIINKVLPPEVHDPFFRRWREAQERYLVEVEVSFYPLPIRKVRLFSSELRGLEMLRRCGEEVFEGDDPLRVFHKGPAFTIEGEGGRLVLKIPMPFVNKDECEVERVGDELMIKIETKVGEVRCFIPLPAITYTMKLSRAKLIERELHVYFEEEVG